MMTPSEVAARRRDIIAKYDNLLKAGAKAESDAATALAEMKRLEAALQLFSRAEITGSPGEIARAEGAIAASAALLDRCRQQYRQFSEQIAHNNRQRATFKDEVARTLADLDRIA